MNIYDSGYVYENISNQYITDVKHEVYLPSLLNLGLDILVSYFKHSTIIPVFRIFILDDNENVSCEISKDVTKANMNISCQNGLRRNMSITLCNVDNYWQYGARNTLWHGMKFRFDTGIVIKDTLYWQQQGVFLLKDPLFNGNGSNKTSNLTLVDKWGIWDGSVYGNTEFKTIIPAGVKMKECFDSIVHEDNGLGQMWDMKDICFNTEYANVDTAYTIKQDAGTAKSEYILKMAKTISSDVYYNTHGNMNIKSNTMDFMNNNFPVVWSFEEGDMDCSTPTLKYNRSKYYNKIITRGAILNGYQFSATVENTNRKSLYNTFDCPLTTKLNNNSKLFSDTLCLEQSMYEMVSQSRGMMGVSFQSTFLPFLDVNMAVYLKFSSVNLERDIYIIDSISYNIDTDCKMSLSLTSNTEVIF